MMAGMTRRFQFGLRNAIGATTWLSVFFASFSLLRTIEGDTRNWPTGVAASIVAILLLISFASPFCAAIALLGPERARFIPAFIWFLLFAAVTLALFPPR
jgi:hypothetical protein